MQQIQLSIPEQCHENWDAMTPTQQGRFCNVCTKQVVDFSKMSDAEVLNYFSTVKSEKVCGRAYPDQLNRPITTAPKKRLFAYWQYLVALVLFFTKTSTAKAQGLIMPYKPTPQLKPIEATIHQPIKKPVPINAIKGTILDAEGKVIPFASVKLLSSYTGVVADELGKFELKVESPNSRIEISAMGFETKSITLHDFSDKQIVLDKKSILLQEVVVNNTPAQGRMRIMMGGMSAYCTIEKPNLLKDTLANWLKPFTPSFKIYPNPVVKGSAVTVQVKAKQAGENYTMLVMDAAGKMLLQQSITTVSKDHQQQLQTNSSWAAGIYYVKLIDSKGKPTGTTNLVVQ